MTDPLVPQPPIGPEVDCTDLDGFMLNVERLMASELVALSSHEVIGAALMLWCRAWKQRPAASLPNDDKVIAAFARMPLSRFRKLRDDVLRGFVLCSDGRLYHSTLVREASNAYERKIAFQRKRMHDAERLRKWRSGTKPETPNETRFVAEGQGQGQGQGQEERVLVAQAPPDPQPAERPREQPTKTEARDDLLAVPEFLDTRRGKRLPDGWQPNPELLAWTSTECPAIDPVYETEKFTDYWRSQAGAKGRKTDWDATWRNWMRKAAEGKNGRGSNHKPNEPRASRSFTAATAAVAEILGQSGPLGAGVAPIRDHE